MELKHTPGPWDLDHPRDGHITGDDYHIISAGCGFFAAGASGFRLTGFASEADARLLVAAPELLDALIEARRAIGMHNAPNDCYATGPLTGDEFRDLVQCPACSAIAMYDAAIAKATVAVPQ